MQPYSSDNKTIADQGNYPPPAFFFKVVFPGYEDGSDTSFQDVSGIGREMKTEEVPEGGENRFVHRLPKSMSYKNLVLKRGIANRKSGLVEWCRTVLEDGLIQKIQTRRVLVYLMNAKRVPIRAWKFTNAYPVKWEVDNFNSTKNEVSIETIELTYNEFSRVETT